MKPIYRITAPLAALAAAALVALGTTAAGAAVLPHVHVVANGSAGYSTASGNNFRNVGATVTPDPAAQNIGGVGEGGIGVQLGDPNTGFGRQIGLVSNGSTFTVEWAKGILAGANVDNCVGNGVLASPAQLHPTTLSGLPVGDPIQLFIKFRNVRILVTRCHFSALHHHLVCVTRHVWRGRAKFQAFDTAGFEVYSATVRTRADFDLAEAGAGIQQDTTGMSADTPLTCPPLLLPPPCGPLYNGIFGPAGSGAHNRVADFAGVFTNGTGLGGTGVPFAVNNTTEVATTAGGLHSNPAIVAPNSSGDGNPVSFSVWAGNPTV